MSEGKGTPDPKGQTGLRGVLPAGTALRGYELKSILGQGAFGITYRARDLTLGRDVAVKEYLPTSLALREGRTTVMPRSPDHAEQFAWGRERFLEEARTLARLDRTPAIVRVHDFLEANGTAYMVMALIEGETLAKKLLREQRLAPEVIERLVFPLLDGLEEVHAIGFLHRDIKPANIMLDSHGRPTLIDFGASRAAMAERSTTLTAIFTPGYAAAEQFTSTDLGPWTDIYGLAATLYHAITGKIPPSAVERILNDAYQPLAELQPEGYDPALLTGIDAALAIRADDRPRSIAEWRHVLRSGEALPSQEATHLATRLHRAARSGKRPVRLTLRGPALAGAIAAAVMLLAGGGWLAWRASTPVGTVVQGLSAEQLEQALAERRKADALAAEKRRLEDEARQKAVADAEAQRQAQAELEQARQARQKAEEELAELKARIAAGPAQPAPQQDPAAVAAQRAAEQEAQRKAETEAAAMRQAEEEAQKRLAAEAEARRQADEAVARLEAERQKAEQEARAKAEAEQTALKKASEEAQRKAAEAESVRQAELARATAEVEQKKAEAERQKAEADAKVKAEAEAAEKGLRLDQVDRKRLQVALTSLGFDTRGTDGLFGARSREMIAAWQMKAGAPATGFLTSAQRDQLLRAAAPVVARWDDEQKKLEDEKGKTDAPRPAAATPAPAATSSASAPITGLPGSSLHDGAYGGDAQAGQHQRVFASLRIIDGRGSGNLTARGCDPSPFTVAVSADGIVTGNGRFNCILAQGETGDFSIKGRIEGRSLRLVFGIGPRTVPMLMTPGGGSAPSLPSPDGLWRGTYACSALTATSTSGAVPFTLDLTMQLVDGSGSWKPSASRITSVFEIKVSVSTTAVSVTRFHHDPGAGVGAQSTLSGQYDGNTMRASGREVTRGGYRDCTFSLTRA